MPQNAIISMLTLKLGEHYDKIRIKSLNGRVGKTHEQRLFDDKKDA